MAIWADDAAGRHWESADMAQWTTRAQANATPEQVLEVLTDPDAIRLWSPIDFEVEDHVGSRLTAGDVTRVTGRAAGVRVGFDVEIHAAGEDGIELSADGPIGIDVRYELAPAEGGSEITATIGLRGGGGLAGRLISKATAALLSAGALDGAARSIARAAEQTPALALA
jgi:uncharacterized protein YndB with AHSA1/START domain